MSLWQRRIPPPIKSLDAPGGRRAHHGTLLVAVAAGDEMTNEGSFRRAWPNDNRATLYQRSNEVSISSQLSIIHYHFLGRSKSTDADAHKVIPFNYNTGLCELSKSCYFLIR